MKTLQLTQDKSTLVDDADYPKLAHHKWLLMKNGYAARSTKTPKGNRKIYLHREVLETPDGLFTDHIDGNKLNNARSNLRVCSKRENAQNTAAYSNNTTGYKGVSFCKKNNKFRACIQINGKQKGIGYYRSAQEAASAYAAAALENHGQFAKF